MRVFWLLFLLVITLPFLNLKGLHIEDITTGTPPKGVSLEYQPSRLILEPISGPAEQLCSLKDNKSNHWTTIISWFFWLGTIAIFTAIGKRKKLKNMLYMVLIMWLGFITFIALIIILPLPMVRMKAPADWLRVDFHSHTWESWDGSASPYTNLRFHKQSGYDCFFVTEHNNTDSYPEFSPLDQLHTVFPGAEISSTDNIRYLLLSDRKFSIEEFENKTLRDAVVAAHKKGYLVIMPHYPERGNWEYLASLDVDGFEIYDSGDHGITSAEQAELIRFCKGRNLLMTSATDYHGWGAYADGWTLIRKPEVVVPTSRMLLDLMQNRTESRVIVMKQPVSLFGNGTIFEPLSVTIRYFGSMGHVRSFVWAGWMLILIFLITIFGQRKVLNWIAILSVCCFLVYTAYMVYVRLIIHPNSEILIRKNILVASSLAFIWYIVLRTTRTQIDICYPVVNYNYQDDRKTLYEMALEIKTAFMGYLNL